MPAYTLELGSSPTEEDCAQLGSDEYESRARRECNAFIDQLNRVYHSAHKRALSLEGVRLRIKTNFHDFGMWFEVVGQCGNDKHSVDALFWLENNLPEHWDDKAKEILT